MLTHIHAYTHIYTHMLREAHMSHQDVHQI